MSIDKIGKGPGATGVQGPSAVAPTTPTHAFEVAKPQGASPAAAAGVSPAEQVRAGQLDMKGYVDLRVNEATAHLEGRLGPGDLAKVRELLRAQIAHDPTVIEMVRAATGQSPPDDEG